MGNTWLEDTTPIPTRSATTDEYQTIVSRQSARACDRSERGHRKKVDEMTVNDMITYLSGLPEDTKRLKIHLGSFYQASFVKVEVLTVQNRKIAIIRIT